MEGSKFTEVIYGPYGDAWKILKILALAEDNNPQLKEVLEHYMKEVGTFQEKYKGNEFAQMLSRFLMDADNVIMRMNR